MTNDLIPAPTNDVQSYTDPADSFQAEAVFKANSAFSKEQNDYEQMLIWFQAWVLQRRHTTSLVRSMLPGPGAYYGNQFGPGDENVTRLADFGFSKMQFFRRCKELEVDPDVFYSYLDECIEQTKQPSLYGMLRFAGTPPSQSKSKRYRIALEVWAEYWESDGQHWGDPEVVRDFEDYCSGQIKKVSDNA